MDQQCRRSRPLGNPVGPLFTFHIATVGGWSCRPAFLLRVLLAASLETASRWASAPYSSRRNRGVIGEWDGAPQRRRSDPSVHETRPHERGGNPDLMAEPTGVRTL
jgi:hypothetical protein